MNDHFSLRDITPSDAQFLYEIHIDPAVRDMMINIRASSYEEHVHWLSCIADSQAERRLIFAVNNRPAGIAKFSKIDCAAGSCSLGADIHLSFRGCGFAKHLWMCMFKTAYRGLGLKRVNIETLDTNLIAHRLYKKLGFIETCRERIVRSDGSRRELIHMAQNFTDFLSLEERFCR